VRPLLLLAVSAAVAAAGGDSLADSDISRIKQICHALAGASSSPEQSNVIFSRLTPYAHDEMTIPGLHVVCDKRCGGLVQLRDEADIYFSYPASRNGHSRIDTVVFGTTVRRCYLLGRPAGDDSHQRSNQSLERTADRCEVQI
jgi:hypothetical protein